ncbi:MAG: RNA polymerase sigma factor [Ruminococcus sp.]|nr:RNA polymerase sigma factor [Ruminococcus sp.]
MSEKEFISCYDEFFDMVWRICFVELSGKKQDVEDAVSDTFLKLLKSFAGSAADKERVKAWLIVTAQNTCRSQLRLAFRRAVSLEEHIAQNGELPAPEQSREVAEALSALNENERSVIMLTYYFGYTGSQTAEILKMAEGSVYSALSRARKKLAKILKGGEHDAGNGA